MSLIEVCENIPYFEDITTNAYRCYLSPLVFARSVGIQGKDKGMEINGMPRNACNVKAYRVYY